MPALRNIATFGADAACRVAGRRQVVRASRFVLRRAYLDGPNNMASNGEAKLQKWIISTAPPGRRITVFDVGANVGRWARSMIEAAEKAGRADDLLLHAFEPCSGTFAMLTRALAGRDCVLAPVAASDHGGTATLHVLAPAAGRNSLYDIPGVPGLPGSEQVRAITIDSYATEADVAVIDFLKIDTEGHDLAVLRGCASLLNTKRIGVVQFEYNQRWISARHYLRDAFELLQPIGYHIGKLTANGVEFYPDWDIDLETFVEANYVACTPAHASTIPTVRWWKTPGKQSPPRTPPWTTTKWKESTCG